MIDSLEKIETITECVTSWASFTCKTINIDVQRMISDLFSDDFIICKKALATLDSLLLIDQIDLKNLDIKVFRRLSELIQIQENYSQYSTIEQAKEPLICTTISFLLSLIDKYPNYIEFILQTKIIEILIMRIDAVDPYNLISKLLSIDQNIFSNIQIEFMLEVIMKKEVKTEAFKNSIHTLTLFINTQFFDFETKSKIYETIMNLNISEAPKSSYYVIVSFIHQYSIFDSNFFFQTLALFNLKKIFRVVPCRVQFLILDTFLNIAKSDNFILIKQENILPLLYSWSYTSAVKLGEELFIITTSLQITIEYLTKDLSAIEDLENSDFIFVLPKIYIQITYFNGIDIFVDFYFILLKYESTTSFIQQIDISHLCDIILTCGNDQAVSKLLNFINSLIISQKLNIPEKFSQYINSTEFIDNLDEVNYNSEFHESTIELSKNIIANIS